MLRLLVAIYIISYFGIVKGITVTHTGLQVILSERTLNDAASKQESQETFVPKSAIGSLNSMRHLKILGIPGGGGGSKVPTSTFETRSFIRISKEKVKLISVTIATLAISYVTYENRETLFNGENFQRALLLKLNEMKQLGVPGLIYYSLGLCLWELIGLTTVPIETVAGMTFNFNDAVIASVVGKVSGALLAFSIGRYCLSHHVRERLSGNDTLSLVENSIAQKPFRSSLCMKYVCFPEIVKNLSLSIMSPVSMMTFLLATCTHGIPYTLLWCCLGKDTASRLRSTDPVPPNHLLNTILLATTVFGFVGSPAILAMWIKDMRQNQKNNVCP